MTECIPFCARARWATADVRHMTEAMARGSGLPFELALTRRPDDEARLMHQFTSSAHPKFKLSTVDQCYPGGRTPVYVGTRRGVLKLPYFDAPSTPSLAKFYNWTSKTIPRRSYQAAERELHQTMMRDPLYTWCFSNCWGTSEDSYSPATLQRLRKMAWKAAAENKKMEAEEKVAEVLKAAKVEADAIGSAANAK
eukprot:684026-Prymnesium_polylepis.2